MFSPGTHRAGDAASPRKDRQGMALVLVLGFLVLLSALIIAFFSSVQTDLQNSKSYEAGSTVKQLVTTATNLVTGQISDGTRSVKVPVNPGQPQTINPGDRLDWASQPGMIRTWDDNGMPWRVFKLYSSRDMVVNNFNQDGTYPMNKFTEDVPQSWSTQPAMYVDLNEPVVVNDPLGNITRNGVKMRASYPILDPLALKEIDGFSITNPPDYRGTIGANNQPTVTDSDDPQKTGNAAPMPVAWIYVLKDGTLTAPPAVADNGRTADWSGADANFKPTRQNPIVGRLAFWTDDESCKLNLNTASEPTPWDTPRAVSLQDTGYGSNQPANHEYQRYPGHPFTTALSPVLVPTVLFPNQTQPTNAQKDLIYGLIPRVQKGGSNEGTTSVIGAGPQGITPDKDRLFANVDEFLFEPLSSGGARKAITDDSAYNALNLNPTRLRRARFFLTANSRAPELNLYGGPRICLWPESSTAAQRTPYDKLAAFCTTLGNLPYYFQRSSSTSSTADYANISRNQDLYKYLQKLTSSGIPGFGGSFSSKFGVDRDQILTEMFDYIRSTNLRDTQSGATRFASNGQVTPIVIGQTQGFGRIHTISQFGYHLICTEDGPNGSMIDGNGKNDPKNVLPNGQRRIQVAFLFEPFSVSMGFYLLQENISFRVSFLTQPTLNGQSLQIPGATVSSNNAFASVWHPRQWGGAGGIRGPIFAFGGSNYPFIGKRVIVDAGNSSTMIFSGGRAQVDVLVPGNSTPVQSFTVNFPQASIAIPTLVPTTTGGTAAYRGCSATTASQWWDLAARYGMASQTPLYPGPEYPDPKRRFGNDQSNNPPGFKAGCVFRQEDVVVSMVPEHSDIRLVAAQNNPTTGVASNIHWVPTANWDKAGGALHFAHIFSEPIGTHALYGFANEPVGTLGYGTSAPGSQLTTALYYFSRLPEVNPQGGKRYNQWNDYDNGIAQQIDGAYINKPDEGNIASSGQADTSKYAYFAWNFTEPSTTFFSPNRLIPSAGMFGSLPTGVKRGLPWQTLLFRPDVTKTHPGRGAPVSGPPYSSPPDHLMMDLFWMPVVEPYAISEPFSTAGKINMNYQIAPFTYIRRATGMYGALKSEQPLVIPNALSKVYKLWDHETSDWPWLPNDPDPRACTDPQIARDFTAALNGTGAGKTMRLPLDYEQTLQQFDTKFSNGDLFRSASQICEMHLVRTGELLYSYMDPKNPIWNGAIVTGDNTRERPYTNLYAKLTTRSNAFTVHIRAQVLRQIGGPKDSDWQYWHEGRDQNLSDYRGSNLVERYIDPADPTLPDFATNPTAVADTAYRFRIVASKKFVP